MQDLDGVSLTDPKLQVFTAVLAKPCNFSELNGSETHYIYSVKMAIQGELLKGSSQYYRNKRAVIHRECQIRAEALPIVQCKYG